PLPGSSEESGAHVPPGTRVLVVEDNELNQMVAIGSLRRLGVETVVAGDGAEGVELAAQGGFDAIVMDVQMPRLDGYAATRQIREREPAGARIPIIAMTAGAIEGDRERALAAGMDDFLTKPLDFRRLQQVLARWVGEPAARAGGSTAINAPAPPLPPDGVVLDPRRIADLRELDVPGETSYVAMVARAFLDRGDAYPERVRAAVAAADAEEISAAAHLLKGNALNLGLRELGAVAETIEHAARHARAGGGARRREGCPGGARRRRRRPGPAPGRRRGRGRRRGLRRRRPAGGRRRAPRAARAGRAGRDDRARGPARPHRPARRG